MIKKNRMWIIIIMLIFISAIFVVDTFGEDLYDKCIRLRREAKYDEALRCINEVLGNYSTSSFAYNFKGNLYRQMYKLEEAIESYKDAIRYAESDKTIMYNNIGSTYRDLGRYDLAIENFNKAIKFNKKTFGINMLDIAWAYIEQGDIENARIKYDEALPQIEKSEKAYTYINQNNKGNVYEMAADVAFQLSLDQDALEFGKKANEAKKIDSTKLSYAILLARIGKQEEAKNQFEKVNLEKCEERDVGFYYIQINDLVHAQEYYEKAYSKLIADGQKKWFKVMLNKKLPKDEFKTVRSELWFNRLAND